MPSRLTLVTLAYAVLLGAFGAGLLWIAIVGGLAVFWQLCGTIAAGATPPEPPPIEDEFEQDLRKLLEEEEDD